MKRIMVTGSQGFVGRHVVAELLSREPDALVLGTGRSPRQGSHYTHQVSRGPGKVAAPLPASLRQVLADRRYDYVQADLADTATLTAALLRFRPDVVIHLASALRDDPAATLFASNAAGTATLMDCLALLPDHPRVVLGSSGAVYGACPGRLTEQHQPQPLDLYSVSKLAAEGAARVAAQRHALPLVVARIFCVVGPGQDERHVCGALGAQWAQIMASGAAPEIRLGTTTTTRDFVDVRDVAVALVTLARSGVPGSAYNVASGVETSIAEVHALFAQAAGHSGDVHVLPQPARPADIPRQSVDVGQLDALATASRRPLAQSIEDVLRWYATEVWAATAPTGTVAADTFTVQLTRHHTYEVRVAPGLVGEAPRWITSRYPGAHIAVLTDDHVASLHGHALLAGLRDQGAVASMVTIPEGEGSKSPAAWQHVVERLYAAGVGRRDLLVNYGGGVVTDVGGFVAATYMRGIRYLNVPTTLLAQHDAAIGGKVALNMPWAKNFAGAFHHPDAVLCDPVLLGTLSPRALAAGIAEAVKVAIIGDPGLLDLITSQASGLRDRRDPRLLGEVVRRAALTKAAALAPDPHEDDLRRPLNLGHTLGHAIETQLGYLGILHGEAVAYGTAVATLMALRRGLCSATVVERIFRALAAFGLPPRLEVAEALAARDHLGAIRLVRGGALRFVLPRAIGDVVIVDDVTNEEIALGITDLALRSQPVPSHTAPVLAVAPPPP